jgi:thiosulfate dehydrogenase [quinone] large subunit
MSVQDASVNSRGLVSDPPIAKWLFNDTRSAPLWMAFRIWIGLEWFTAGMHKFITDGVVGKGWLDGGASLKGFWAGAVAIPQTGSPKITYTWFRDFLNTMLDSQAYQWFAWLIVFGEIAVGLGLIFGCLTAIAAFFGTLMNMSFLLAGSGSTNPLMFGATVFVILAWKNAGYWGLDRYVLPAIGTPWTRGTLSKKGNKSPSSGASLT